MLNEPSQQEQSPSVSDVGLFSLEGSMAPKLGRLADRFWGKVGKTDTCWLWVGKKDPQKRGEPYGSFYVSKQVMMAAHRVSWILEKGPIPFGMFVCHTCDVPLCVKPDHLFLGTQFDNMRDKVELSS